MKIKKVVVLLIGGIFLTSCTDREIKETASGVGGGAAGGAIVHSLTNGNKAAIVLGIIGGYFVGTAIYNMMNKEDVEYLSEKITNDIKHNKTNNMVSWINKETGTKYEYTSLNIENNCSIYKVRAQEAGTSWVLNEQYRICLKNGKLIQNKS